MNCLMLFLTFADAVTKLFTAENIFPSNVTIVVATTFSLTHEQWVGNGSDTDGGRATYKERLLRRR